MQRSRNEEHDDRKPAFLETSGLIAGRVEPCRNGD
jgi:hypothetical protein